MIQIKRNISKINDSLIEESQSLLNKGLSFYKNHQNVHQLMTDMNTLSIEEIKENLTIEKISEEIQHFLSIKEELTNEKDAYIILIDNVKNQLSQFTLKKVSDKFLKARQEEIKNYEELCQELDEQIEKEKFTASNDIYVIEKLLKIIKIWIQKTTLDILYLDMQSDDVIVHLERIKSYQSDYKHYYQVMKYIQHTLNESIELKQEKESVSIYEKEKDLEEVSSELIQEEGLLTIDTQSIQVDVVDQMEYPVEASPEAIENEKIRLDEKAQTLSQINQDVEMILKEGLEEQLKLDTMISEINLEIVNQEEESFNFLPETPTEPYVHKPPKDMNVPVLDEKLKSISFIPTLELEIDSSEEIDILIPMHDFSEYEISYQSFDKKAFPDLIQDYPHLINEFERMTLSQIFTFLVNSKMNHENSDEQHLSLLLNTLDIKYKE